MFSQKWWSTYQGKGRPKKNNPPHPLKIEILECYPPHCSSRTKNHPGTPGEVPLREFREYRRSLSPHSQPYVLPRDHSKPWGAPLAGYLEIDRKQRMSPASYLPPRRGNPSPNERVPTAWMTSTATILTSRRASSSRRTRSRWQAGRLRFVDSVVN